MKAAAMVKTARVKTVRLNPLTLKKKEVLTMGG